jgi:hypothetical protein
VLINQIYTHIESNGDDELASDLST